jgi:2-methylisocitrate lyase-like PEP mutase family enzyme
MTDDVRATFRTLHESGTWLLPNPWDVGSAKLLQHAGFVALATTSSGFAASIGKHDQHVTRDELVAHVAALCAAVTIPVNVDAERCFADTPEGVAETVELLAGAGASGISIEDFDPATKAIDPLSAATERVAAAVEAAHRHGIVLTARAENHIYGAGDLDDTLARLTAYHEAGADCLYPTGFTDLAEIAAVVALGAPVNILALPKAPDVAALTGAGVRRISTGGGLAWAAYGGLMRAARELQSEGTTGYFADGLSPADRAAFD